MARINDACTDIVTAINAASLSQDVTAIRSHVIDNEFWDGRELRVQVFPRFRTAENIARTSTLETHTVDVLIRKPVTETGKHITAEVDGLLTFVDELCDLCNRLTLATSSQKVIGYTQEEYLDQEALHEQHLFVSTVTFTIRDQF